MDNEIKLFEGRQIRSAWDNEKEEGNEGVTICHTLKMHAADGKI